MGREAFPGVWNQECGWIHLGKGEEKGKWQKFPSFSPLPEGWGGAGGEREPCGHVGIRMEEKLGMRRGRVRVRAQTRCSVLFGNSQLHPDPCCPSQGVPDGN